MNHFDISVIICTYNRAGMFRAALESLKCQETDGIFSYEIVIINDGSTDNTKDVVREVSQDSQVLIRYFFENGHGVANARNKGIKKASGDWIAFFDDDQLAEPDWLKELLAAAAKSKSSCIGGAVHLHLPEQKLRTLSPIFRSMLGEKKDGNELVKCSRKNHPGTGNILIKKKVFDATGQFDGSLKSRGSDLDFTRRVRMAGIQAWYTPKAVVHHRVPPYRLKADYLIWKSISNGISFAYRDYRELGIVKTFIACFARICQALLINMPLFIWGCVLKDSTKKIERKCLLYRALGYTQETLSLVFPWIFRRERLLARFEFRKEREFLK